MPKRKRFPYGRTSRPPCDKHQAVHVYTFSQLYVAKQDRKREDKQGKDFAPFVAIWRNCRFTDNEQWETNKQSAANKTQTIDLSALCIKMFFATKEDKLTILTLNFTRSWQNVHFL